MAPDPMLDEETAWDRRMREHEATLKIGARVQVRVNGECEYWGHKHRDESENNAVGIVSRYDRHGDPSHQIQVWFSPPWPMNNGHKMLAGMFAAAELLVLCASVPDE